MNLKIIGREAVSFAGVLRELADELETGRCPSNARGGMPVGDDWPEYDFDFTDHRNLDNVDDAMIVNPHTAKVEGE